MVRVRSPALAPSLLLLLAPALAAQHAVALGGKPVRHVWYVDAAATGAADGRSFADAFVDLQDALAVAVGGDVVLVAGGTYRPDGGTLDPTLRFVVPADVRLIGGFAGNAGANPLVYLPDFYETVLTGDLLGDDLPGFGNRADNSEGVVEVTFPTTGVLEGIRGFTFRGSEGAPCVSAPVPAMFRRCRFEDNRTDFRGAGLDAADDLLVQRCSFEGNRIEVGWQDSGGAGLAVTSPVGGVTVVVDRCTFTDNEVVVLGPGTFVKYGGGLFVQSDAPDLDLVLVEDSTFAHNEVLGLGPGLGGGMHSDAVTEVLRSTFLQNHVDDPQGLNDRGGGFSHGSTSVLGSAPDRVRITSSTFLGNRLTADLGSDETFLVDMRGAGAWVAGGEVQGCLFSGNSIELVNPGGTAGRTVLGSGLYGQNLIARSCTFSRNLLAVTGQAGQFGDDTGGAFATGSSGELHNSIAWQNARNGELSEDTQLYVFAGSFLLDHCDVQGLTGGYGGVGNVAADPLFIDALGPDLVAGTADDDLRLGPGSPVVDAGEETGVGLDALDLDDDGDRSELLPLDLDDLPRNVDDPGTPNTGGGTNPTVDLGAYES